MLCLLFDSTAESEGTERKERRNWRLFLSRVGLHGEAGRQWSHQGLLNVEPARSIGD